MSAVPVDLRERMEVLFWQEMSSYKTEDYLTLFHNSQVVAAGAQPGTFYLKFSDASDSPFGESSAVSGTSSPQETIKEHWREIICEWAYNLVDHFDLPREKVSIFTNLLDRYLYKHLSQHPEGISKRHFQLLALTCLYITIKLDCQQGFLSIEMMIHLSREKFTKEQMVEMEKDVCNTLEWKLHPPTSYVFLRHFLLLLQPDLLPGQQYEVLESARFLMELAALDYHFVTQRPSRVALAALLNAIEEKKKQEFSSAIEEKNMGFAYSIYQQHYDFLLSLVAPIELPTVEQCRFRLHQLHAGLEEAQTVHLPEPPVALDASVASPVSVAHRGMLY